jgi:hypothetical protein
MTSFLLPIGCGQTRIRHLFYFFLKVGSKLLESSKLKEPLFPSFFNVQNKTSTCFRFLNSKELVIEGRLFEGVFFFFKPQFIVEIKSLMMLYKVWHTQSTPNYLS